MSSIWYTTWIVKNSRRSIEPALLIGRSPLVYLMSLVLSSFWAKTVVTGVVPLVRHNRCVRLLTNETSPNVSVPPVNGPRRISGRLYCFRCEADSGRWLTSPKNGPRRIGGRLYCFRYEADSGRKHISPRDAQANNRTNTALPPSH